jgi:penicillin amidase
LGLRSKPGALQASEYLMDMRRRFPRVLLATVLALVIAGGFAALWARGQLRGSLAQIEGTRQLEGLSAAVQVTRDALGIPTVRGATRIDVARATGFLHAQDRYFQMDLARRRAAGELSALVGPRALPLDREIRIHRFRAEAQRAVSLMSSDDRALLVAYAEGVNAGLRALATLPFEYLVLRQDPTSWRTEDSFLVVLSMFVTLQDIDGSYESTLATMAAVLPPEMYTFMAPRGSEWDAPIDGEAFGLAPIPGPDVYDLRSRRTGKPPSIPRPAADRVELGSGTWNSGFDTARDAAVGSNNFAVSGRLTADGGALVANDMHLTVRVPNTWYRAAFEWPDATTPNESHRVIGVTLPGVPAVVVGSNTQIAWGFTNTYADWSDVVLLDVDLSRPGQYLTPHGWRPYERFDEVIPVAGQRDEHQEVLWTEWGPLIKTDHRGRPRAYRWVAHAAEQLAVSIRPLESARTLEEAFDQANGLGTPGQNLVVADRSGRIGWTVYGSLPRRIGIDGQQPASWSDGSRGWKGWLSDAEYPRIVDPADGRIWTANARVVSGPMLDKLGDGSYEIGSRAHIIRDRLFARNHFTARDLLAIQLDTSADFLSRWRGLLLQLLSDDAVRANSSRAQFRDLLANGWSGVVAPDSVGYRLTRAFRDLVSERVMAFVLAECYEADPAFDYTTVRRRDAAIFALVTAKPLHLLDPEYATWDALLLDAVDATVEQAMRDRSGTLRDRRWSEFNAVEYRHPLSAGIPLFGRWLDMPSTDLPGDLYTPRVHWRSIAASERMIVSPGREADGIMHMPTGQSGHPLSPFYANSHAAWARGEPTPFLPGPAVYTLILTP